MLMGVWRVTGSTRLQNLAVRRITVFITVFNCSPSGNELVSILNRTCMLFVSKYNGTLVDQGIAQNNQHQTCNPTLLLKSTGSEEGRLLTG
eukprot:723611-Pelagomonas_calceolata.AAC.1